MLSRAGRADQSPIETEWGGAAPHQIGESRMGGVQEDVKFDRHDDRGNEERESFRLRGPAAAEPARRFHVGQVAAIIGDFGVGSNSAAL